MTQFKKGDQVRVKAEVFIVEGDVGGVIDPSYTPTSALVRMNDGLMVDEVIRFFHDEIELVEEGGVHGNAE